LTSPLIEVVINNVFPFPENIFLTMVSLVHRDNVSYLTQ